MATTRVKIDDEAKSILQIFEDNMTEIGELNKLVDTGAAVAQYVGPDLDNPIHITQPRPGNYKSLDRAPNQWESYWVREITFKDEWDGAPITQDQNDNRTS